MLFSLIRLTILFLTTFALVSCANKEKCQTAWITPLEEGVNPHELQRHNYEVIALHSSTKGLKRHLTLENTQRGDERNNWQANLTYSPQGLSDFSGELVLTYWEVPFHNQMALSLQITANLWDHEHKRSREYLPFDSPEACLLFYQEPEIKGETDNINKRVCCFPMVWNRNPEALYYEALLTAAELNKLVLDMKDHSEARFYFSSAGRNYELQGLSRFLQSNFQEISRNINLRLNPSETSLLELSQNSNAKKLFNSPWLPLGKQHMKIQTQYTSSRNNGSVRLILSIAGYNSTLIRNAYMGNASLIFSDQEEVYFVPLEKLSYFSSLQHKQTSFLSFATIPSSQPDFFEQRNWKHVPKEFWQFNITSAQLSDEELTTIQTLLSRPTAKLTFILNEDLQFNNNESALKYLQNLLKVISSLKETLPLR